MYSEYRTIYAFILIGIAIYNIIISHRRKDDRMIMIRSISLASATGSMLFLERIMPGTFSQGDINFITRIEAYTGFAAFVLIIWLGFNLIRKSFSTQTN